MGKMMSTLSNPFRNFNVESRAHKVISQSKPQPAPKHKSDVLDYERIIKEHPEIVEDSLKKHANLDRHLRDVFVRSSDAITQHPQNPQRPLPLDKSPVHIFDYGVKEPEQAQLGKVTLRGALQFITDHQTDAQNNTAEDITEKYLLPQKTVEDILKYFRVFEVYVPQERLPKAKFAGPIRPKVSLVKHIRKLLPESKTEGSGKDNT